MSNASRSPRRRRLRRTARILCGAAVIGSGLWLASCWWSKPPPYRPDERPDEITSALSSTVPADAPPPRFAEVSTEAGLRAFRNFEGQRTSQIPEDMGPGMAWGDYDNDGFKLDAQLYGPIIGLTFSF